VPNVTYITDAEIDALPDDPMDKFIEIERIVRERYEATVRDLREDESALPLARRYMAIVLPAAQEYEIESISGWSQPSIQNQSWDTYNGFIAEVDFYLTKLRLRRAARSREHSIALDAATKVKLRHLTGQLRGTIDKLDVSVAKKDRLYKRLADFEWELDRTRTRLQVFGSLLIEAADDFGEAAVKLEPVVRGIERITAALSGARRTEEATQGLPAPKEKKRIEGPKAPVRKGNGGNFDRVLDDEIPF
jgi:hypothetical protein